MSKKKSSIKLIVLSSTIPRWANDSTPSFVYDMSLKISVLFSRTIIIAPHHIGARKLEVVNENILIKRVKYFFLEGKQDIFYGSGAPANFRFTFSKTVKLTIYVMKMFLTTLRESLGQKSILNPNWIVPQGLVAVIVKKIIRGPVLLSVRGSDVYMYNGKFSREVKKFTLKNSDTVVVNSEQVREECMKLHARKYVVIPSGYDDKIFSVNQTIKRDKKLTQNQINLISVGRLVEVKGMIYIVKAVEKLLERGISVSLKIAGEGEERRSLEHYIKSKNLERSISLTGWLDKTSLAVAYNEADLYVGATIVTKSGSREAFGNVYVEAMACGLPVIITDTAGASEIVDKYGCGTVVDSGSVDSIATAIEEFYLNPSLLMEASRSAKEIADKYSMSNTSRLYKTEYRKLIMGVKR